MRVTRIRDDVWKFKGVGSVYLIKANKWILIDAGEDGDREFLTKEISKVVSLDKIGVVLLTHLHYDHLGAVDLFSNAEIFASEEDIEDFMKDAKGFGFYVNDKKQNEQKIKTEKHLWTLRNKTNKLRPISQYSSKQ